MRTLLVALLFTSLPLLAADKSYEKATLIAVALGEVPLVSPRNGRFTDTQETKIDNVFFSVTRGEVVYTGNCGLHYEPKEWTPGQEVDLRFNKKGDEFWVKRPNGKEHHCFVTEKKKADLR